MEKWYYFLLDVASFLVPFLFSFERKKMHFIRFWKPFMAAIITVGIFFIIWDIYFAYQKVWWFNDEFLLGIYLFKLPLEEYLFFLLIPFASNFIHYALEYFYPKLQLTKNAAQWITAVLFIISFAVTVFNTDKLYTLVNFGTFAFIMLMQLVFQWKFIRRFYLSFIIIYIPFFLVNSALTGSFTEHPVVLYNNAENLQIRLGTIPLEDSFYCFSMLYGSIVLFEYLREKWKYSRNINFNE